MSVQLVIFDLGSVLVNVDLQPLVDQLARDSGRSPEQITQLVGGPIFLEQFERGVVSPEQFCEQLKRQLDLSWSFKQFVSIWNSVLSEKTDTTWLLPKLRQRYRLAVITNINSLHDAHIRRTWPVFSHVHHWVASCDVGLRKPDPEIYRLTLDRASVSAEAAVYVDDVEEHVRSARGLGVTSIHFTLGVQLDHALQEAGLEF